MQFYRFISFNKENMLSMNTIDELWSKIRGSHIFYETITSNRLKETMKFLRFDMKSTQSVH